MSGEIERVLERAANDPAFLALLLDDRDAALAAFDLPNAVRDVLASASADQLRSMIAQIQRRPPSGLNWTALTWAV